MKGYINNQLRFVVRKTNTYLSRFGVLLSKPEVIHGSPAFSGATTMSRKDFIFKYFFDQVSTIAGDVIEAGIHWGYGLLSMLKFTDLPYFQRHIYGFDSFAGYSKPNNISSDTFSLESIVVKEINTLEQTELSFIRKIKHS